MDVDHCRVEDINSRGYADGLVFHGLFSRFNCITFSFRELFKSVLHSDLAWDGLQEGPVTCHSFQAAPVAAAAKYAGRINCDVPYLAGKTGTAGE